MWASSTQGAHMRLLQLSFLVLLSATASCATVGMMRELPPDAGQLARYDASIDTIAVAAEAAINQQGLAVAEVTRLDATTRVLIAEKPRGVFSKGEYVRVRIARDSAEDGFAAVRVVTKPGYLLEIGHRERAPHVFRALDARLSARAIGPWPGMRLLATPHGGPPIIGNVVRVSRDTVVLQLSPGSAPRSLAIGDLGRLAISRGRYNRAREGMVIGVVVGGVVGALIGASQESGDWVKLNGVVGFAVGSLVGVVVGGAVGSTARTDVWSDLPLRQQP